MSNVSYYTAEGLKNLKEELHLLRDIERPKASQAIGEARLKTRSTTPLRKRRDC